MMLLKNSLLSLKIICLLSLMTLPGFGQETGPDIEWEDETVEAPYEYFPTLRTVPQPVVDSFQNSKTFEYANDPEYWNQKEEIRSEPSSSIGLFDFLTNSVVRTIFWMIVIGIVAYALIQLIASQRLLGFYKPVSLQNKQEEEVENMTEQELETRLNQAIKEERFRDAVRFYYLLTLRKLAAKELLVFEAKATNETYVNALKPTSYGVPFAQLTRVYDFVWYGGFVPHKEQFNQIQSRFQTFTHSL